MEQKGSDFQILLLPTALGGENEEKGNHIGGPIQQAETGVFVAQEKALKRIIGRAHLRRPSVVTKLTIVVHFLVAPGVQHSRSG